MSGVTRDNARRQKRAALLSSSGALVLGLGLGLALPREAGLPAVPALIAGLVAHGWGMFETHRLERAANTPIPHWADILYRLCWLALLAVAILIAFGLSGDL